MQYSVPPIPGLPFVKSEQSTLDILTLLIYIEIFIKSLPNEI
jgi:hypothetical protein